MGQGPPVTHIIEPYHHSLSWNYFHPARPEVLRGGGGQRWALRSQRPLEADSGWEGRKLCPSSTSRSLENPCPSRGSWNISQPKVTGCWAADIPRLKASLGPSACLSCNRAKSQWGGGSSCWRSWEATLRMWADRGACAFTSLPAAPGLVRVLPCPSKAQSFPTACDMVGFILNPSSWHEETRGGEASPVWQSSTYWRAATWNPFCLYDKKMTKNFGPHSLSVLPIWSPTYKCFRIKY